MEERKELSTKEKRTLMIVSLAIVIALVFGISYAYFMAVGQSDEQTITTANLSLTFDDGTAIVNATDISPLETDDVLTSATKKTFTISRPDTSKDIYAKIELTDINATGLGVYDFKWMLYQGENKIATGDFGGKTSGSIVMATNQLINSTDGVEFTLYIWINETGLDQNALQGKTFSATIKATGTSDKLNTLTSVILGENNDNVTTTAPTFASTSTDQGLFVQQGDVTKSEMGFPTYYYRGDVTNNYVSFGEVCSLGSCTDTPLIWRIVRINEDGSIRLINESHPTVVMPFNTTGVADYVDTSGIYSVIQDWYDILSSMGSSSGNENYTTLDSKIVKSTFCNDISGNYTAAYDRLTEQQIGDVISPIFICPAGAKTIYSKKGMITADEVMYSFSGISGSVSYITNKGTLFWTLTPHAKNDVFALTPISGTILGAAAGVTDSINYVGRTVINLSPDVVISGGNGSSETPYTIK